MENHMVVRDKARSLSSLLMISIANKHVSHFGVSVRLPCVTLKSFVLTTLKRWIVHDFTLFFLKEGPCRRLNLCSKKLYNHMKGFGKSPVGIDISVGFSSRRTQYLIDLSEASHWGLPQRHSSLGLLQTTGNLGPMSGACSRCCAVDSRCSYF
jgi:hypothetical protein